MWIRLLLSGLVAACVAGNVRAQDAVISGHETAKGSNAGSFDTEKITGRISCTGGNASGYPCGNVDLLSMLPISELGGGERTRLNDIWGWTDPQTGREYALVGRTDGLAIVDVSEPEAPVYLGSLPSHEGVSSTWRDVKTIGNYALVVMDLGLAQRRDGAFTGIQIFDLTTLRNVSDPPQTLSETVHYSGFGRAHNVVANEETNFAYAVGTETCGGGLHMIDFANPLEPVFAGCFNHEGTGRTGSGYTHDAQCVIYHGPDEDYEGREICFGANETSVSIADVTDKSDPKAITKIEYPAAQYTHQVWLTPDHRYLLLDDELDEWNSLEMTRTLVFDVVDLDDPQLASEYLANVNSIDHNQYVVEDRVFQANYSSGLRILDVSNPHELVEVGYFDTYPVSNHIGFDGAWSSYPFFASGIVIVSSIREGLFVLQPTGPAKTAAEESELPDSFALLAAYPNPFNRETTIRLQVDEPQQVRVAAYDVRGREVAVLVDGFVAATSVREMTFDATGLASGVYVIRATGQFASGSISVTLRK